jgi:uncharacterized iron-regulated protein
MNRIISAVLIPASLLLLQSCAAISPQKPAKRQDTLIGKIFDARTGKRIDFDSLIQKIRSHDVIYLSEKHDNPDQHHIQHRIIEKLVAEGLKPCIGFEFFAMDNTPDILNFIDSGKAGHSEKIMKIIEADLRKKLQWDTQSDTMWQYYYSLLRLARKEQLSAAGLDLSETLKRRITRKGIDGITPIEKQMIYSTGFSDPVYKKYMISIFRSVHCGMDLGRMQARLYDTWVARNDKMALSITKLSRYTKGPVVIIIGGGHTEYGLGVIDRVHAMDKNIRQINIALQEISVNPSGLSQYLEPLNLAGHPKSPPADFLWFTQRVSYDDPCEKFRHKLKKMKKQEVEHQ